MHKYNINEVLNHDDDIAIKNLRIISEFKNVKIGVNPLELLRKKAEGPKISKPKHIFILIGESLTQSVTDDIYSEYHIADAGKKFKAQKNTISMESFLPAGLIS